MVEAWNLSLPLLRIRNGGGLVIWLGCKREEPCCLSLLPSISPLSSPPPPLWSLVVHQRLDLVHQLTCYLQDMLDIMTLSHLCGTDTQSLAAVY